MKWCKNSFGNPLEPHADLALSVTRAEFSVQKMIFFYLQ
jgi:hypothetical protein